MVHWISKTASALALLVSPGIAAAQGGPPLLTDDPGTPGASRWEINAATLVEASDDARLFEAPLSRSELRRRNPHPAEVRDAHRRPAEGQRADGIRRRQCNRRRQVALAGR